MKRYVNISLSCITAAMMTMAVSAQTQPAPGAAGQTAKPAPSTQTAKPAPDTAKPAPTAKPTPDTAKPAPATQKPSEAQPTRPMGQQGATQAGGAANLGTVRIPRDVRANGEALPAGSYQVRVTETPAAPPAPGQTPQLERWAEFLRGGKVVAREVVTVVPASDIKQVAEVTPPRPGGERTEVLKGGDYLRLWLNRGGNHYLIHFNIAAAS